MEGEWSHPWPGGQCEDEGIILEEDLTIWSLRVASITLIKRDGGWRVTPSLSELDQGK